MRAAPDAGEAVRARLLERLTLPAAAMVAGYFPLQVELDPRPLMRALADAGHGLALPRMEGPDRPLAFHAFDPDDSLIRGGFGVMEPRPDRPRVEPAVVLVPLLGFDRRGRRLGWGKGYYDRTLHDLRSRRPEVLAIGLAFAAQEVDEVPADASDEVLDLVVTEEAVHDVAGAPGGSGSAP